MMNRLKIRHTFHLVTVQHSIAVESLLLNPKNLHSGSIQCLKNPFHDWSASRDRPSMRFSMSSPYSGIFCDVEMLSAVSANFRQDISAASETYSADIQQRCRLGFYVD